VRVAAVGDLHVGRDSHESTREQLADVAEHADVLVVAGDLTQLGTPDEGKLLAGALAVLGLPVVAVLGNHDHESDAGDDLRSSVEDVGVTVLDGDAVSVPVGDRTLGVVGDTGFGGGFAGAAGSAFGEPEMKAFMRRTERSAERIEDGLRALDSDVALVLLHYSPIKDTVVGERPEIFPFLGSFLLARAVDAVGADLVVHGHAHAGSEHGLTPGGVRVRNVAQPLIRRAYRVFRLDE
jgi:Icc-related predicted phosphoesterase